ncbi:ubiquitin conjugation factor E4 B-like [Porites lutea]|uniref:ubiquitin conjugation factor E4 B-like n=1 Tax=Porites lutea TaxID=51062 RepID=UPI003CC5031F
MIKVGGTDTEERADLHSILFPSEELKGQFKLMTEMFHLTHSALHTGLTSTIQHYNKLLRSYMMMTEAMEGTSAETEGRRKFLALFVLQWDTCLQDAHFMRLCSEFYVTSAAWLLYLLENCASENQDLAEDEIRAKQREIFTNIPEFYVKDMCSWFSYVAIHKPCALKGLDICVFVDCCATLIERRDLMPGPVAASRIVTGLLSFAEICSRNKRKNKLLDTTSWGSGIEGDLVACVAMCPAVRDKLCPALLHTYCAVDIVEGLDVDKEEFDKFSARFEIVKLLEILWKRPDIAPSILKECGRESFQSFLGAVLDTLLYVLKDGLLRLTNVRKLQCAKKCDEKWKELSIEERQEKEQFLRSEEHVSKSFMEMANATLAFLEKITEEDKVSRCFSRHPLSMRAADAIIGFLHSLCGRKCSDLKVQNMEKYSFDPRDLLVKILTVLVRMANASEDREFVKCLAANPDYSRLSIEKALCVVQRENLAADHVVQDLGKVMQEVQSLLVVDDEHFSSVEPENTFPPPEESPPVTKEESETYIETLEPLKFDTAELVDCHAFRCRASQPICPRSSKVRALMREATQLKNSLPIHPNAAIFVRQDENRMDFVRALITGTVDTPYSRGCFVFDIYFPSSYPTDPPLVKIITTGNGTVRFNPNLYADGKVCLSLLGTWHGGDASEKWDPKKSSLYQVLVSIQGMMFTPDPCFNEPGYEGIRGTDEGDALCKEYNANIKLYTIRHAMVGQLRQPTPGFEDVIRAHFRLQREEILTQCAEWLTQCADEEEETRMRKAIDCLKAELDKL